MDVKDILEDAALHVKSLYEHTKTENLVFHNIQRIKNMIAAADELLEDIDLDSAKGHEIKLALWFLFSGYTQAYDNAEKHSLMLVEEFMAQKKLQPETKTIVKDLIKLGFGNRAPVSIQEKIFIDSKNAFIGTKQFAALTELWREETNAKIEKNYSLEKWRKKIERLLRSEHKFYTEYARNNWQKRKKKNLKSLIKAKKKWIKKKRREKLKSKLKATNPDRGVQTLFRVALRNHIKLSDIADTKANILLSVNAIIISLALSNLIPKLDNPSNTYLIYPTLIFVVFSVVSIILSIIATQPNVTKGEFNKEDVKRKAVNLIFFGNFHKMSLKDYEWAMFEMLKDQDYIYGNLTKDLYFLGNVLERKYRILRWNYIVFMIGIIISVIAFFVAFKIGGTDRLV